LNQAPDLALLNNEYEQALIKQLSRYADTLKNAALNYEPHVLAYYLRDLAGDSINTLIGFISKSNSLIDLNPLILMRDKLSIV
jgi:hypothetical protein